MKKKVIFHVIKKIFLIIIVPEGILLLTYWFTINPAKYWYEYLFGFLSGLGLWIGTLSAISQLLGKTLSNWLGLEFFQISKKFTRYSNSTTKTIDDSLPIIGHIKRKNINELWNFIEHNKHIILRGASGCGKSSALKDIAQTANEKKFLTLFLNSSILDQNINKISDLEEHLGLDFHFIDCLENLNQYVNVLLIFDQIDNVDNKGILSTIYEIFSQSIDMRNIYIVGVCDNITLPEFSEINKLNFPEYSINELSIEEVDELLNSAKINSLSQPVKMLCRRLIFLNLLLRIFEENNVIEAESYVQLFDSYISLIHEKIGNTGISNLSKLAYEKLANNEFVFILRFDQITDLQRSIKANILTKVGERKYKFYHEQIHFLLASLYTFESDSNLVGVLNKLSNFHAVSIIIWFFDKIFESPAENQNLFNITISPKSIFSYYDKDSILQYISEKKISKKENNNYRNFVLWLNGNIETKKHFIKILLKNEAIDWFKFLNDNQFFDNLNLIQDRNYIWNAVQYLELCSLEYPEEFFGVVKSVKVSNFYLCNELICVISKFPIHLISRYLLTIEEWVEAGLKIDRSEFVKLIIFLEKNNHWVEANILLKILLSPAIDRIKGTQSIPHHQEIDTIVTSYLIDLANESLLPKLVEKYPEDLFEIAYENIKKIPEQNNYLFERSTIEESNQNLGENLGIYLIKIIRESLIFLSKKDTGEAREKLSLLLQGNDLVYHRIAIYVIGIFFEKFPIMVNYLYDKQKFLLNSSYHHEYWHFVRKSFGVQKEEVKSYFIEALISNFDNEKDKYHLMRWFQAINDFLPEKYHDKYIQMKKELGEQEHPDLLIYHQSLGGPLSPVGKNELIEMDRDGIIDLLNKDIPVEGYGGVAQEGFVLVLQEAVKEKPEKFVDISYAFDPIKIPPMYVYHYFEGLIDGWKSGKVFFWKPVLKQMEKLLTLSYEDIENQKDDSSWRKSSIKAIKRSILRLISTAVRTKSNKIQNEYLSDIRDLLIESLNYVENCPIEQGEIANTPLGIVNFAINENRAIAVEALINYALHYANIAYGRESENEERLEKDVKEALGGILNSDEDIITHSIFGKYFPNLVYLDKKWAKENIDSIFPLESKDRGKFVSAWGSYLYRGDFFIDPYQMLRDKYKLGIHLLSENNDYGTGLREILPRVYYHLYFAYWRDLETLFGQDSLIQLFLATATDQDIAKFVLGLKSGLKEVKPGKDDKQWLNLRKFWRVRFDYLRKQPQEKIKYEMAAYLSWVPYFPEDISPFYKDIRLSAQFSDTRTIFEVLDYLNNYDKHNAFAVFILNDFLQNLEEPRIFYRKDDLLFEILNKGMHLNETAREKAIDAINRLGELGYEQYRPLLPEFLT